MFQALLRVPTVNKIYIIPAFMEFPMKIFKKIYSGKNNNAVKPIYINWDLVSATERVIHRHFIPKLTHSYILKAATIKVLKNK